MSSLSIDVQGTIYMMPSYSGIEELCALELCVCCGLLSDTLSDKSLVDCNQTIVPSRVRRTRSSVMCGWRPTTVSGPCRSRSVR